ncbi:LpqB family beta-propeller domain-containing protein [Agrococcus sp. HG114]|uniref:LpqB family beta-propeller domain-containing protein n=1 Tax=Agrococcus sp. HG114 TaxID=2969757 RepID=UPI00215B4B72|nr:LpqB family beta-propeller domain-containing protein [Agrococcus sp. HG114]MCR8671656.1 LpqB family beta-propeller domain-containing protein [Agrococcus sp. HG114]
MRRTLAAALAAAALALSGCVAIPDSGPVTAGQVDVGEQTSDLVFIAEPPRVGATQEEIVRGFLAAAISPDDDFAIAREYLVSGEAERWSPSARVLVRSGQPEVTLGGETAATAVVTAVSQLDAGGALSVVGSERMLEFRMLRVAGEWRIAQAPDGIVLSAFHFAQLFRPHALHWVTPDGTRAVPEVRWFERTATTLPGRMVDALLAGPATWLSPAVSTAGAPEARRVGEPLVEGTIATVTLDFAQVQQRGSASLQPLAAQLALSMRPLGVREVRVQVEALDGLAASSADAAPLDDGDVDQRPLVLDGTTLRPIGGGGTSIDDVGPALARLGASDYTVGALGGVATTGSTALWLAPGADPVAISADAALPATTDDSGWVILQERAAPQRLLAWRGGERSELQLPPGADRITAIELSRDGARLAITTVDGSASEVWVAAVIRDALGRPVSLGEPYALPRIDGVASDVTWTSPTQVAVLAASGDQSQVVVLAVGGESEQLPAPGEPVRAIVGGSEGTSSLRALGVDGSLLSLRGRVWSPVPSLGPITLIATQQ